jgi:hypothetical protein
MRLLLAALIILTAPFIQGAILRIDDGTAEEVRGFGARSDIFALNSFNAIPSGVLVNSVRIAWGSPLLPGFFPNGSQVTVYLWDDPNGDGDPSDANVLASVDGVVSAADTNTFVPYRFGAPVLVSTARFFVGFRATATEFQYPAAADSNGRLHRHRSFIAEFDPGEGDPNNLYGGTFAGFLGENGVAPGNFLIRAMVRANQK